MNAFVEHWESAKSWLKNIYWPENIVNVCLFIKLEHDKATSAEQGVKCELKI